MGGESISSSIVRKMESMTLTRPALSFRSAASAFSRTSFSRNHASPGLCRALRTTEQCEEATSIDCPSKLTIHAESKRSTTGGLSFFPREEEEDHSSNSTVLFASPLSIFALAALPGAEQATALLTPFAELVRSWDLPDWLVHWGHPGNMAVVLLAMGGYGTYLGWQIRLADDMAVKAKAKDLHPKLFAGLFFFFAAGAVGGVTSLVTQGKPLFESSHALTGFVGLGLLGLQSALTTFFEGNPDVRGVHAWLGLGIMAFFFVHAALGLQLGLSI